MTVNASAGYRKDYTGNGSTTLFPVPFYFLDATHLQVLLTPVAGGISTPLTLNLDYTVSGAGTSSGGSITTAVAYSSAYRLTILRNVPLEQQAHYVEGDPFPASSHEEALDKLTMIVQQQAEAQGRALSLPSGSNGVDATLPPVAASQMIGFNASGTGLTTYPANGTTPAALVDTGLTNGDALVMVVQPLTGAVGRSQHSKNLDVVSLRDFGALGNGVADDTSACAAANNAGSTLHVPAGTYKLTSNVTFTVPVCMEYGATFVIPTGVTLDFEKGLQAGVYQIFNCSGTGKVVFNPAFHTTGFPEWWGAAVGGSDCSSAIMACVNACKITQLQAGDYYITSEIAITTGHKTLRGVGQHYDGTGACTRICVNSATIHGIHVYTNPATTVIANMIADVRIENLDVTRVVAVTPPTAGSAIAGPTGVRLENTHYAYLDRVFSSEHTIGFLFSGTCQTHASQCYAKRTTVGTTGIGDFFKGYWLDGASNIAGVTAAGGNASTYLVDCAASVTPGLTLTTSIGFDLLYSPADSFLVHPETSAFAYGIRITGSRTLSAGLQKTGDVDVHITDPVLDAFTFAGIYFKDISDGGAINIKGGYAAVASGASSALAALGGLTSYGCVYVAGFQGILWPQATCKGVSLSSCHNVTLKGNQWLEAGTNAVALDSCVGCVIQDQIKNTTVSAAAAAVHFSTSAERCLVEPVICGAASKFTNGVVFNFVAPTRNEVNVTMINPACLTGVKLQANGTTISTTGTFNTNNLATGIFT